MGRGRVRIGGKKGDVGRVDKGEEEDGGQEGNGENKNEDPRREKRPTSKGFPGEIEDGGGGGGWIISSGGLIIIVVDAGKSGEREGEDEGDPGISGGCRTTKVIVDPSGGTATTAAVSTSGEFSRINDQKRSDATTTTTISSTIIFIDGFRVGSAARLEAESHVGSGGHHGLQRRKRGQLRLGPQKQRIGEARRATPHHSSRTPAA